MRRKLFVRLAVSVCAAMALQTVATIAIVHRFFDVNPSVDRALVLYAGLAAVVLTTALTYISETMLSRMLRREEERMRELAVKNAALEAKEAELTRAEQLALVGRMSAGIAHEIGNPLAAVLGYVGMLREEQPESDVLRRVERELNRINGLIRELLDYARPAPLKKDWHELQPVIADALSLLSHQPRGASVTVDNTVPSARVWVDRERLTQILLNILLNSADAMGGTGKIAISAERTGETLRVSIKDEGPGFSADALKHAGSPFYSTKGPGKGTGLGLAVSKRLMEEQGGTLTLANANGALITLTMRVAVAS